MTQTREVPSPSPEPAAPDRTRRRWWPRIAFAVAAVLALALAAGLVYAYTIQRSVTSNITRGIELPRPTPGGTVPAEQQTGTLDYVLLGSDRPDDGGNGRSDSLMLVHLNQARDQAYIISFPRDMYVDIPGHGQDKINEAYALGGPALTVRTLQGLVGVEMDHVVLVDFEGFEGLTEDLGGVTVTNKTAFSSHGFDYPKGKITVRGQRALWFVRERHALPRGDLDRAANQRNVLEAIVQKGLSAQTLADPVRFTTFLSNASKHRTVDNSLTDAEIRTTALSLRLTGQDIELLQAPLSGFGTSPGGQSIDVVDTAQLAELSAALKSDDLAGYVKKHPQG